MGTTIAHLGGRYVLTGSGFEPPPIPSNEANLTPWTKSNFLAVSLSSTT